MIKAVNNSGKPKFEIPLFNESEQIYYEKMKDSIKLWQKDYADIYKLLQDSYNVNDEYFGNKCKPIAKKMRLYEIFGVDMANGVICGNTILCYYYNPLFSYNKDNGPYVRKMATIGGVALKENEIIHEDKMYGLTQKYFELDYLTVKSRIIQELEYVAVQIGKYLKLKDKMIKLES